MIKTISKIIVRDKDRIARMRIEGESDVVPVVSLFYRIFKIGRAKRYRVTYTLDKNGPLMVVEGPADSPHWRRVVRVHSGMMEPKDKDSRRFVCFLPANWEGRRVRRTMRTLKGK